MLHPHDAFARLIEHLLAEAEDADIRAAREVRVSRTVVLPLRTSPGLTGCCHFSVSTPGEPKELESSRSPSQNMRMNSAQICQPDAIRLPISAGTAASTWKGRGSNSRAKAITSASVMARAGRG